MERVTQGFVADRGARGARGRRWTMVAAAVGILAAWAPVARPAAAQDSGTSVTRDHLASLVLTMEDAPEGAALSSSGPVDLSDLGPDSPSVFATLQTAGLQAVHQNCFDPWAGDLFVCSQALLFPNPGEASRGLGSLTLTEDLDLGEEGGWGTNEGADVLEAVWRRSNVLLWLTLLDQGDSPSLSFEADALPLARQMDAKAAAAAQDEGDGDGGIFGNPFLLIAAIVVFLLALGGGLWLLRRSRNGPPPEAGPAAAPPSPAPDGPGDVKYCTNCGTPDEGGAKFCQSCGTPFD